MRYLIRASCLLLPAFCLLALSACQPASSPDGRLRVVASNSLIGDLARQVGGEYIDLSILVQPGQDTHTYEPLPPDSVALASAGLIVENGLGYETWLDDLATASGSRARRIALSQGIVPLAAEEHAGGDPAEPDEFDPHIWHSVPNVIVMIANLERALAEADPLNAEAYAANAAAYTRELQALDIWIRAQVESLPPERRQLVTSHATLGYFAREYGFTVIGTVYATSTEGAAPSARELARMVDTLRAQNVPAVFGEYSANDSLLEQAAAEAGVPVAALYTDALGPPGSDGDTYLKLMRANVARIVEALRP